MVSIDLSGTYGADPGEKLSIAYSFSVDLNIPEPVDYAIVGDDRYRGDAGADQCQRHVDAGSAQGRGQCSRRRLSRLPLPETSPFRFS